MKRKLELSPAPPSAHPKETKTQQVANCLIGDKSVDSFGNDVEEPKNQILSYLTEDELNKAYNTIALTSKTNFSLFKPNFKIDLVNKLLTTVAMGEQYAFSTQVLTQEARDMDKKEVLEKRKILFISKNNTFQMCYCTDDWNIVQTDVKDEALINILKKYKEGQPLDNVEDLATINQILTKSGIRTQQDKAERLLKTSPELMLEKITFTDCSGRTFSNISAFEFVLWALDTRYMVNMMFNCLHKNEIGLELAEKLQAQYDYLKEHGVTYTLEGQTITEKHFDFSVLIKALQDYVDNFDKWNGERREAHWCKVVGMAQCYVPAHVMQHYCDPNMPFYPLPKFEAEQFIRTLKFYNYFNSEEMSWSGVTPTSDVVLGENFGISRRVCRARAVWGAMLAAGSVGRDDLLAITALCKVRTSDYLAIPSKLASLFDKKATEEESLNSAYGV